MEYHNPTLRVLRILELIDANSGGLSLTEIANLLDLPKGTISPILKTLAATNYVVTDGSLYKIGPHTFELGLSYASGQNALSIIRSEMRSIVSQVDEVCQMECAGRAGRALPLKRGGPRHHLHHQRCGPPPPCSCHRPGQSASLRPDGR